MRLFYDATRLATKSTTLHIMLFMEKDSAWSGMDSVLSAFLDTGETSGDRELETLMSVHAEPVARKVIRYRLTAFYGSRRDGFPDRDRDDILSNVMMQLLVRLRDLKQNPKNKAILNFQAYVRVLTHHACDLYFRNLYPERCRLKSRVKYLMTHDPLFAVWKSSRGKLICGFQQWRIGRPEDTSSNVQVVLKDLQIKQAFNLKKGTLNWQQLRTLVNTVFQQTGKELELNQLVTVIAELSGYAEKHRQEKDSSHFLEFVPHPGKNQQERLEQQSYLEQLWKEILELPLLQKIALLFSLRDAHGKSLLFLFPILNVVNIRGISMALEISANDLAQLWNLLPLDDKTIGERCGVTRQEVINFRKSARARLSRRMRALRSTPRASSA